MEKNSRERQKEVIGLEKNQKDLSLALSLALSPPLSHYNVFLFVINELIFIIAVLNN